MSFKSIITIVLAALLLSACTTPSAAPPTELPAPTAEVLPSPTSLPPTPAPTDTALPPTPQPNATPEPRATPAYETLAPNKIKAGDFTLEVSVDLYANDLRLNLHSVFPANIEESYPEGNMPRPFTNADIQIQDTPVTLKMVGGGGGGGGGEEGMTQRGSGIYYGIEPALTAGEQKHVAVTLTFADYIGIPQPVLFEYDLVVKDALKR